MKHKRIKEVVKDEREEVENIQTKKEQLEGHSFTNFVTEKFSTHLCGRVAHHFASSITSVSSPVTR